MYRHRIDRTGSQRLKGHDYSSTGIYFVTLCTKHRVDYFGEVRSVNAGRFRHIFLVPNEIGKMARKYWLEIPEHYPFVELDQFVIMPDHIHGLLFLNRPDKGEWKPNEFGPQSQNLGAIIRGFKSSLKRFANQHDIEFEWQSRYHDTIIKDRHELDRIRWYIIRNPYRLLNRSNR